jgi:hypothetical protein
MKTGAPRRFRVWSVLALALSLLAALLWARLKLVTGLPRTAYAEPDGPAAAAPPDDK